MNMKNPVPFVARKRPRATLAFPGFLRPTAPLRLDLCDFLALFAHASPGGYPTRIIVRTLTLSCFALLTLGFVGCASYDRRLTSSATQYLGTDGSIVTQSSQMTRNYAESISYWDGDGVSGAPSIVISLGQQKASFYKGGRLVAVSAISTGREGHDTPPGNYKIIEKKEHHTSNLYGNYVDEQGNVLVAGIGIRQDPMPPGARFQGAPMPYWMRLTTSGVGLHAGFLPGVPDSRGCIRLPERMAAAFFANAPLGTPVTITY
jgi:hypothetical protein